VPRKFLLAAASAVFSLVALGVCSDGESADGATPEAASSTATVATASPAATTPTAAPSSADSGSSTPGATAEPTTAVSLLFEPTLKAYPVVAGSRSHDVAPAADGGVWCTGQGSGTLRWLDPATRDVREIQLGPWFPHAAAVSRLPAWDLHHKP